MYKEKRKLIGEKKREEEERINKKEGEGRRREV